MAYEKVGCTHTFRATTGLKQYQAVDITGANNRLINPTTIVPAIGVLISSGTTGSTGRAGSTDSGSVQTVQFDGIAKCIAGSTTIDASDFLTSDTDGRCSTAAGSSTGMIFARSLGAVDTTSTSAHIISVLLKPNIG